MTEIPSEEAEKSSGGSTGRCSCDIPDDSDSSSWAYDRCKSAERRFVQAPEISDVDLCSVGTYLVVPGQDQTSKTTPGDKKNPSYSFSRSDKKVSLDEIPPSPLLSHDLLLETAVNVDTAVSSDVTDLSNFHVLESVLQQSSSPGVREGFIIPQDVAFDSDSTPEAKTTPQQCASSSDSLDSAANDRLFHVSEEHVAEHRIVTVERKQCTTKEHAAMSVVRGPNAPSRQHRAVTVSRSQTWSFRDKAKSDQFLREAGSAATHSSKHGGSSEDLLDDRSAHDVGLRENSSSSPERSKTLPHRRSRQTATLVPYSPEEPPAAGAVQSCLLRDYDKDKDWSFVQWTDEAENQ